MKITIQAKLATFCWIYLPMFALLVFCSLANVSAKTLFTDVFTIAEIPAYSGLFSNIGSFLWCISCAICLFTYAVVKYNRRNQALFFLYGGLISLIFWLDDFFLLHEKFFNKSLNIPQKLTLSIYAFVVIFYLIKFHRKIKETDFTFLVLALALVGLALSVALDAIDDVIFKSAYHLNNTYIFLEDGSKLIGIAGWLAYQLQVCFQAVREKY